MSDFSRRGLLAGGAAALLTPTLAKGAPFARRSLRVAHMTDFHVQPELNAPKGMEMALQHAMKHRPELILSGGDHVMDSWSQDEARTALQWKIFKDTLSANVKNVPVHCTVGNHDLWGIDKKDSHTDGNELKWGKKWFMDEFGYRDTHHSFDQGDWHFVILDNIWVTPDGYNGILGPAQLEWLAADLAATRKPTLVMSHIPLLSVTALVGSYDDKTGDWTVGGNVMTKDLRAVQAIFEKNPHVKIALSGHTHMVDRVDYKGVSYICGGAVCGNWWKGPNAGFAPGYTIYNLHSDGTFDAEYLAWGWTEKLLS